jgi:diguanylate cyclase (GGDEF)-like protein
MGEDDSRDQMIRAKTVPALVLALSLCAIAAIVLLQAYASAGSDAQLSIERLDLALTDLQTAPFASSATTGGSPAQARAEIKDGKRRVAQALASLRQNSPSPLLDQVTGPLRANYAVLGQIYEIGAVEGGFGKRAAHLAGVARGSKNRVEGVLAEASRGYDSRASTADIRATVGSAAAILLLLIAFLVFYRRSARLATANAEEARTDPLTGLGNRRALLDDLEDRLPGTSDGVQLAIAMFDLDGFKQYNDTFGHPAGDALLARLGRRLGLAVAKAGTAYRMGGDEFCVLALVQVDGGERMVQICEDALTESGDAFEIGCSHGLTLVPSQASSFEEALELADRRMYEDKAGRSSASRQSADVLLEVLNERDFELREHISGVAAQALATGEKLGLSTHELWRVGLAAELHDIGKTAIPDALLDKPGPLDEEEWKFMHRHTVIGERIVRAAASLAPTAGLVRSSHERFDGGGYPDGLRGEAIPLGARIIAVSDAYEAMVTGRPYRDAISVEDTLEELRRCSGSQFDPRVVDAFMAVSAEPDFVLPAAA